MSANQLALSFPVSKRRGGARRGAGRKPRAAHFAANSASRARRASQSAPSAHHPASRDPFIAKATSSPHVARWAAGQQSGLVSGRTILGTRQSRALDRGERRSARPLVRRPRPNGPHRAPRELLAPSPRSILGRSLSQSRVGEPAASSPCARVRAAQPQETLAQRRSRSAVVRGLVQWLCEPAARHLPQHWATLHSGCDHLVAEERLAAARIDSFDGGTREPLSRPGSLRAAGSPARRTGGAHGAPPRASSPELDLRATRERARLPTPLGTRPRTAPRSRHCSHACPRGNERLSRPLCRRLKAFEQPSTACVATGCSPFGKACRASGAERSANTNRGKKPPVYSRHA